MNKEEPKEITAITKTSPKEESVIRIEDYEDLISIAQRREGQIGKLIDYAIRTTTPGDWVNQNGKPYLCHSGAERIARHVGIKITGVDTKQKWSKDSIGQYYIYVTTGTVALPGKFDSIEAIGTCSQRDKFFAWKDGAWKDDAEVDETNIIKASYTNFIVNGITHLLGLRNLSWTQLESAGISEQSVVSVQYGGKSAKKPPSGTRQTKKKEKAKVVLSPEAVKKRDEIWKMAMEMKASNEEEAKQLLEVCSAVEKDKKLYKAEKLEELTTEKWIDYTHKQMKERYDKEMEGKK